MTPHVPVPVPTPALGAQPARTEELQPVADLNEAPLPTAATLRRRSSVLRQVPRFVDFNLRILRMAGKGHH